MQESAAAMQQKIYKKISTKKTDIEHVQKIRFLTGLHAQFPSPETHAQEINHKTLIDRGILGIKKYIAYEKGVVLKVLIACALVTDAKEMDEKYLKLYLKDSNTCLILHQNLRKELELCVKMT